MAETAGGLKKHSIQFEPEHLTWLQARKRSRGGASIASIIRELIDDAIAAEQAALRAVS